jgi:hypothetical protein
MLLHLEEFSKEIKNLKFDSSLRPCAKTCEHLAAHFYAKNDNNIKKI